MTEIFTAHPSGLILYVRVTPGARHTKLNGITEISHNRTALKISVHAPPEDGMANKELISFLANQLSLPKKCFCITAGGATRQKTIIIEGKTEHLTAHIRQWMQNNGLT